MPRPVGSKSACPALRRWPQRHLRWPWEDIVEDCFASRDGGRMRPPPHCWGSRPPTPGSRSSRSRPRAPVTPGETQLSPTASWCRGLPQPPTPLSEQETEARPGELTCRGPLGVSLSQVEALFSAACRARMAGSSGLGVGSPVSQDTHQPLANWTGGHRLQDRCPVASEAASKGTKLSPMLPVITTTEVTLLGCCSVSRAPPAPRPRQAVRRCPTWLPPETPTGRGGRTRVPGALSSGVGARAGGPSPPTCTARHRPLRVRPAPAAPSLFGCGRN